MKKTSKSKSMSFSLLGRCSVSVDGGWWLTAAVWAMWEECVSPAQARHHCHHQQRHTTQHHSRCDVMCYVCGGLLASWLFVRLPCWLAGWLNIYCVGTLLHFSTSQAVFKVSSKENAVLFKRVFIKFYSYNL